MTLSVWDLVGRIILVAGAVTQPATPPQTLTDLVAHAMENNPEIRLAMTRVDSARAEGRIARALPNPTVAAAPNAPYQYSASLPLDLGPQRVHRTGASRNGSRAAEFDLDDLRRQVAFAVRRAYYDLLLIQAQLEVAAGQRDFLHQVLASDSVRVRTGDAPARNLIKSEIELARADAEVNQASAAVRESRLGLQALVGVAVPDPEFAIAGRLTDPRASGFDALQSATGQDRPDLLASQRRRDQAAALRRLAGAATLPVPTVTLAYAPRGGFDQRDWWTIGPANQLSLGLGLQLPLFYRNGGERDRASAGVAAATVTESRTQLAIRSEIAIAGDQYRAASALVARYQGGLLSGADTALAQTRYAYTAGAASLLDLLDAIRTSAEVRLAYARAVHDYWVGGYALAAATGKDPAPQ